MKTRQDYTKLIPIGSLLLIIITTALLISLKTMTKDQEEKIAWDKNSEASISLSSSNNESQAEDESENPVQLFRQASNKIPTDPSNTDLMTIQASIHDTINRFYNNNFLTAQDDILKVIQQNKLDVARTGIYFMPNHPAQVTQTDNIQQLDVPLLLQNDPRWAELHYGSDAPGQLYKNGCAIVSLAMIQATYDNAQIEPQDILDWSQDKYYLQNQGTSWDIFYDFAQEFGYQFENFGNDFDQAMAASQAGKLIVISVKPGTFTEIGHILIVRAYDPNQGLVYVNDPNDDPSKMHSLQGFDQTIIQEDAVNYWAIYK